MGLPEASTVSNMSAEAIEMLEIGFRFAAFDAFPRRRGPKPLHNPPYDPLESRGGGIFLVVFSFFIIIEPYRELMFVDL